MTNKYLDAARRLISQKRRGETKEVLRVMAARGWKSTGDGVWALGQLGVDGIWTLGKYGYQVVAYWDSNRWFWSVGQGPSCPSRSANEGSTDGLLSAAEAAEQAAINRVIADLVFVDDETEVARLEALLCRKRTFYVDRYIEQAPAIDPALADFKYGQGTVRERLAAVRIAYVKHEVQTTQPKEWDRSVQSVRNSLGYNWLWFGPVAVLVLLFTEQHTIGFAWTVGKVAIHRWNWGGLLSPSAAFCWAITAYSMILPVQGVLIAKKSVEARMQLSKRIFPPIVLLLLVLAIPFLTDTLIWGSFPFTYDAAGVGRLRMIPFIPWPTGGYGVL